MIEKRLTAIWDHSLAFFFIIESFVFSHSILALVILPFIVGGAWTLGQRLRKTDIGLSLAESIDHFLPKRHLLTHSTRVDVVIYLLQKLSQPVIILATNAVAIWATTVAVHTLSGIIQAPPPTPAGTVAIILVSLAIFGAGDFGIFLSHYTQHKIPILWEFHKVHHSATFLTPLTTYRFHPIGNFLDALFSAVMIIPPVAVAEFLYGFSFTELMVIAGATYVASNLLLMSSLQHSHFPISFGVLDRVVISPLMHQVHHSVDPEHWDKNFGSRLSIWDGLFGTRVLLKSGTKLSYGLNPKEDQQGDYQRVWWCYFGPLIRAYQLARTQLAARRPGLHHANAADEQSEMTAKQ